MQIYILFVYIHIVLHGIFEESIAVISDNNHNLFVQSTFWHWAHFRKILLLGLDSNVQTRLPKY